ncbi:glycoside hydrolase family 125 protein [Sphingobacterium phlebotomi]|uniref:Glycoside hydrolase family 125 protein n=1 Tax=Sphingobacterium phlebotomi TaxID=2605433 RepID=A0A5D4HB26_9SPHI|nr:glycoside hydrolase family 125 protein [Sphingobacterium phlebotomi]TYR38006.1 glycoside hydrolase family 125 protein [Sphingobacterium phlebotomi]
MQRRTFIKNMGLVSGALYVGDILAYTPGPTFKDVRTPLAERHFTSPAIEQAILEFSKKVKNKELAWLFGNCLPNTLDTTVNFTLKNGKEDTYVITGDIDAMWLRDSTAQVWPYLPFMKKDSKLRQLIAGVINRQTAYILQDPYANAFYNDPNKLGKWKDDITDMQPGIHERKWEIDSLCYPIRLAYHYWKETGDTRCFDQDWVGSIKAILKTFREQQRKENLGPYRFQRNTFWATDGIPLEGYGYPVKPVGLICSMFRPSDDATIFPFLIPSNFFAVVSLKQASEMIKSINKDHTTADELMALALEVEQALQKHAVVHHAAFGDIYAYEVNGFGSYNLMDDANVPSLLALPYLDAVRVDDPIYQNTRRFVLSESNPFYFDGSAGKGIGSPHTGFDRIWPIALVAQGLTSQDDDEIRFCIKTLQNTHAGTGFMHESFHKDDPSEFTRSWFAWANTIFAELLWKVYQNNPKLLS